MTREPHAPADDPSVPASRAKGDDGLDAVLAHRLRERANPQIGDEAFVHLADLRDALTCALMDACGVWLDFGSGTAPYRDLLPNARLVTADLPGAEAFPVEYELSMSGSCPCMSESFDGVLSTQVLEHVEDPRAYLHEAFRVLRSGGRLVLSTHGVWEDHGGTDLWRWTADGLAEEVRLAGFEVERVGKLTGDARAVLLLLRRGFMRRAYPARGVVGLLLTVLRWLDARYGAIDRYSQRQLKSTMGAAEADLALYVAVIVEARRPGNGASDFPALDG